MTVSGDVAVASPVLWLVVDLGDQPPLREFIAQQEALMTLFDYCLLNTGAGRVGTHRALGTSEVDDPLLGGGESFRDLLAPSFHDVARGTYMVVRRTSLASPWEVALAVVAEKSTFVAYGVAALLGLERLLKMVMEWQRHRLAIDEARQKLNQPLPDGSSLQELLERYATEQQGPPGGPIAQALRGERVGKVLPAAEEFGPIKHVEIIADHDQQTERPPN